MHKFYNIRVTLPLVCEKYLLDKECSSYYNQLIDRTMCVQIFFQVCTCYEFENFLLAVDRCGTIRSFNGCYLL